MGHPIMKTGITATVGQSLVKMTNLVILDCINQCISKECLLTGLVNVGWTEVYLGGIASGKKSVGQPAEGDQNRVALFDQIKPYKKWIKCVTLRRKSQCRPKPFWDRIQIERMLNSGVEQCFSNIMFLSLISLLQIFVN